MTAIFDTINKVLRENRNKPELLKEAFIFLSKEIYNSGNDCEWWFYQEFKERRKREQFTLGDWEEYFSFLHDKDHETDHRATNYRFSKVVRDLEKLFYDDTIHKVYDCKILFREIKLAKEYFNENFIFVGPFWARKGSYFEKRFTTTKSKKVGE